MNKAIIIICALASVIIVTGASAQDYKSLRTNTWSIYGQGGVSNANGLDFKNVNPASSISIAPAYGGGVNYNLRPWIRFGLNYEFSKFNREQRFSSFQPLEPSLNAGEGITELVVNNGGLAYRNMWTMYHNTDFTIEFNIVQLLRGSKHGRFNLYAGAGIGMMFANGNTYSLGMGYEKWVDPNNIKNGVQVSDNWASRSWVQGTNTRHYFDSPYIPAILSAEYDVTPNLTLGLKGQYKALFSSGSAMAPKGVGAVAFVVRFNLVGAKQGFRPYKKRYEEKSSLYNQLQVKHETYSDDAERVKAEYEIMIRSLNAENDALKRQLEKSDAALKESQQVKDNKLDILFSLGSATVSESEKARLVELAGNLNANEKISINLVAEASADGSPVVNQRLSELRLANIIAILKANGISDDRIRSAEAIGDANKIYNRRVRIEINE